MCLIRCALTTGKDSICPSASSWFTKKELKKKEALLPKSAAEIPETSGRGWEFPQHPKVLTKNVAISLYRRN